MGFALGRDHPGIERVVDHKAMPQHGVIVRNVDREPQRNRKQSGCLRGKVHAVGIGAPDDVCDPGKRRVGQAIILDEGVEGAALAPMSEGDAWDVVRDGAGFFSNLENLSGRDVDESARPRR